MEIARQSTQSHLDSMQGEASDGAWSELHIVPPLAFSSNSPNYADMSSSASTFMSSNEGEDNSPPSSKSDDTSLFATAESLTPGSADDRNYFDLSMKSKDEGNATAEAVERNPLKRPRGRPRKHEKRVVGKVSRGRSKTGCFTCRIRKKKCDEDGFPCGNCRKTAKAVCTGYPVASDASSPSKSICNDLQQRRHSLPHLISGVEDNIDRLLFDHFNVHLSKMLSVDQDDGNPFNKILYPLALKYRGLMHALLCLSATHLTRNGENPQLLQRQSYHLSEARNELIKSLNDHKHKCHISSTDDDPVKALAVILCVISTFLGEEQGQYACHLDAINEFVKGPPSQDPGFTRFLFEFKQYYDACNSITSLKRRRVSEIVTYDWPLFVEYSEVVSYLGIGHALFEYLARITKLRDRIRSRDTKLITPVIDYEAIRDAQAINSDLHAWKPHNLPPHVTGTSRQMASMLYRKCIWIYLYRTLYLSGNNQNLHATVEEGLDLLDSLLSDSSVQAVLLTPLFLLGCGAFDPEHRVKIKTAFDKFEACRGAGNIISARKVVEKIWQRMDEGDEKSWDWESMMEEKGWDFLIT